MTAHLESLLSPLEENLKLVITQLDLRLVLSKFEGDKKHRQDFYRMVVPDGDGTLILTSIPKGEGSKTMLENAYRGAFNAYGYLKL
jgi:3-dehydroquinate synthase